MRVIWNGIVRNEAARIQRCVNSLLPHVDGAVIVDTGSTDGTQDLIRRAFEAAGKPVEIHAVPFENFGQARNAALQAARNSSLGWDYLLLADADMEFIVDDPSWTKKLNGGPSYDVKQVAGNLIYWNRRLLHRSATGVYLCPTHEYLDVATAGNIDGAWFKDSADGSNRPGKFARDIELLEKALQTETNPGLVQRMTFYLAQSYFDAGNWQKAAEFYKKRTELGGFDEEVWNAQVHYAHCLDNQGDRPGFVWEMLRAFEQRPHRLES
ncbi:MAG TPA: glycosyltransferase, partial [Nitrospiraceae bacterium]